jgi:hypothetical protein
MTILLGSVWVLIGLGVMGFGLWLYYTLLPLFYASLGAGIGFWLGLAITGSTTIADAGWLEIILAIVGAGLFALAAYLLEPLQRIITGTALGGFFGIAVAYALGGGVILSVALVIVGAAAGSAIIPLAFDPIIIVITAVNGAAMIVDGAYAILDVSFLDRFTLSTGDQMVALLIWIGLAVLAMGWQSRNSERWVRMEGRFTA